MGISLKQSLKLAQQLRMTPQLQQAIKLLQLSRVELEDAIRKELHENPVLEEMIDTVEDDPGNRVKKESGNTDTENIAQDQDPRKQDEFEWENYVETQFKGQSNGPAEAINYDNFISKDGDLRDHLVWQANLSGFNDDELEHALTLISYIDDNGYIKMPLEDIAQDSEISLKDLKDIIPFIHEFDPPGVGARDLTECLTIQARHLQEDTNDLMSLITDHLDDLQNKNYKSISEKMGLSIEEVQEMAQIVLSMDPKPGRAFSSGDTQYVTPDVYIHKVGDEYVVTLNEEGIPKLQISQFYRTLADKSDASGKGGSANEYINDKLKAAVWLIKSIHQRQRTIYKVTESIVKQQIEFFEKGPEFIKPMILKDIAHDIEMHESTVSRVTTNKFVYTPRGMFELKYFFNSSISKTDGDSLASESVKLKIKKLVAAEDTKKPLSDQKIVDLLKKDGIQIARRTVAKYRDVLGILPSGKRKKYY